MAHKQPPPCIHEELDGRGGLSWGVLASGFGYSQAGTGQPGGADGVDGWVGGFCRRALPVSSFR